MCPLYRKIIPPSPFDAFRRSLPLSDGQASQFEESLMELIARGKMEVCSTRCMGRCSFFRPPNRVGGNE